MASTTPPWNPPDGLVCACEARNQPISTAGPAKTSAAMPDRVAGAARPGPSPRRPARPRSRSPRRCRSTVATPVAAMNKMNSSPTVSNPRYSKLTAETTPVALVWATAMRLMMYAVGPGIVAEPRQARSGPTSRRRPGRPSRPGRASARWRRRHFSPASSTLARVSSRRIGSTTAPTVELGQGDVGGLEGQEQDGQQHPVGAQRDHLADRLPDQHDTGGARPPRAPGSSPAGRPSAPAKPSSA